MAILGILPGTEGVLALKSRWDAEFRLKAVEEATIVNDFDPVEGGGVGDYLYIRIIPTATAQVLSTTTEGSALTYNESTILRVYGEPRAIHSSVAIPEHMVSRLGSPDAAKMEAGLRKTLLESLDVDMDSRAGSMATSIGTILGPSNFDKSFLLNAQGTLATNAKSHVKIGSTPMHLKYHPTQIKYLNSVAEIANAESRGDAENPNVKGVILKAWGMTFAETGNITTSAGKYWNMLFAKSAFARAWNKEPYTKVPQDLELNKVIIAYTDYILAEVFDEDCVILQSA